MGPYEQVIGYGRMDCYKPLTTNIAYLWFWKTLIDMYMSGYGLSIKTGDGETFVFSERSTEILLRKIKKHAKDITTVQFLPESIMKEIAPGKSATRNTPDQKDKISYEVGIVRSVLSGILSATPFGWDNNFLIISFKKK